MRRHACLLLIPVLSVLGVAACGGSSDADTNDGSSTTASSTAEPTTSSAPATTTSAPETTTSGPETTTSPPETTTTGADTTEPAPPPEDSPLAGFDELSVLQSTIPDFDSLEPIVETDNPGTRVILFQQDGGRKVYKSVFVKRTNRLKIINIDGEGPPIFNDTI